MARKKKADTQIENAEYKKNVNALPLIFMNYESMNQKQEDLFQSIMNNTLTIAIGPPGTAKTYVSCAAAIKLLKSNAKYEKIYLVKSVTTLEGEDIGYLKGGLEEKMDPFIFSFKNNIEKIVGKKVTDELFFKKKIEVLPMAYLRGISISNALVVFDEAQNTNKFNMRTLMTRIGSDCKLIVLGDTKQCDLKNRNASVLKKIYDMVGSFESVGRVEFTREDIVRSKLVQEIEDMFEEHFEI